MNETSPLVTRLLELSTSDLDAEMRRGETPDVSHLVSAEYRGINTATWLANVRARFFVKGFERRTDGSIIGYNRRVEQSRRVATWSSAGKKYAYFGVRTVDPVERDNHYLNALLLDYAAETNVRFDLSRPIRDYLVRAESGTDHVLLGRAFLGIGAWRLPLTYFVLERDVSVRPPSTS